MRIAHIGDVHIAGKWFERSRLALELAVDKVNRVACDIVVFSGDIFHRHNIADKYKTTGEQQKMFIDILKKLNYRTVYVCTGNHDSIGTGKSSLEFLSGNTLLDYVTLIETPSVIELRPNIKIGFLPWIHKNVFYANQCKGLSHNESNKTFTENVHNILGVFKESFSKSDGSSLLFGHIDVQGTKINSHYVVEGTGYSFTENQLLATGADYASFSHIHKRQGAYVGALYQTNFGEEGNPQGFEIVDVEDGKVTSEFVEITMPEYKTYKVDTVDGFDSAAYTTEDNELTRMIFSNEDVFNHYKRSGFDFSVVEKTYTKKRYIARTEAELNCNTSTEVMLKEFIKLNPIPEGIKEEEIMEAVSL